MGTWRQFLLGHEHVGDVVVMFMFDVLRTSVDFIENFNFDGSDVAGLEVSRGRPAPEGRLRLCAFRERAAASFEAGALFAFTVCFDGYVVMFFSGMLLEAKVTFVLFGSRGSRTEFSPTRCRWSFLHLAISVPTYLQLA